MSTILELDWEDKDDPCEYVNNMTFINELSKHAYTILCQGRKYDASGIYTDDFRDELEVRAECNFLGNDSYGERGSEFSICNCEDEKICKFAGSEFKSWSKTDPDMGECGCLIDIKFSGLGKEWSFKD